MAETVIAELHTLGRAGKDGTYEPVPRPPQSGRAARKRPTTAIEGLSGGRAVQRTTDRWQFTGIDNTQKRPLGREETTIAALRSLRDLDPVASHAVWNYLRMVNPGHDLRTYVFDGTGSETKEEGPAQAYLDELARRVGTEYGGGLDQLHNVLALELITSGAVCAEVAPTEDLSDVEDWYPVEPSLISFQRDEQDNLRMGQRFRDGTFHLLNPNQVFYIPLDPDVEDPYGRPPLLPALASCLAKGQMINDLRAVAHNQGYPRIDVSIKWEAVMAAAPLNLREPGMEKEFKDWTEGVLSTVVDNYESLNVDDTFVHYDWVDIKMVGGAAGVGAFDFASLEKILSRQVNSALKTLPILLGINETTSETHGSIQWQIQVQGVSALQRLIKRTIEKLANTSLQIKGLPAHAKVEYEKIRTVDRLFEAQADFFETRTVQIQEMQGWRGHDEAAELITGHEAFGPIVPIAVPAPNLGTNAGGDTSKNLNTGTNPEAGTKPPGTGEKTQSKDPGGWAAWTMLMEGIEGVTAEAVAPANRAWAMQRAARKPKRDWLNADRMDPLVETFVARTRDIFFATQMECIALLSAEGFITKSTSYDPDDAWSSALHRDVAKDIADQVFGIGYSRQMKALLRDAFEEGIRQSGVDLTEFAIDIDDRLIEQIWRTNRPFVLKLRTELKDALRDGTLVSLEDVRAWFENRAWREDLMGRFLARQGIAAGYAWALSISEGFMTFVWTTSAAGESCPTCLSRSGTSYTYDELQSIGFPGSIELECGANCRCSLEPE